MELPIGKKTEKVLPKIESALDNEKFYVQRLMHVCQGNINQASILSGWSRATIYRKIAYHGVKRSN